MASHPDAHSDTRPPSQSDDIERVSPMPGGERESIEDSPGADKPRGDRDITP